MINTLIEQTYKDVVGSDADLFFELKSSYDHTLFPHKHDYYEFCLIVSGEQRFIINDTTFDEKKGALIFFRPEDMHSKAYLRPGEHMTIAFPKEVFNALFSYLGEGFTPDLLLSPKVSPVVYLGDAEQKSIVNQFKRMFLAELYDQKVVKVQYKILLIQIFSKYFLEVQLDSKAKMPKWFESVVLEMQKKDNFSEGMPAFLKLSGTSHEHLCRLTKKYLQQTPTQWINHNRLNYAAKMLQYSNLDVTTICYDAGFGNLSYFYQQFKKKFAISPAKYRETHLNNFAD
ncbi:MAG: AraC family transcriptional regulator [Clostridia bacterium]|nr:AraC family transcriptional regulator [Clostridia bacterium]